MQTMNYFDFNRAYILKWTSVMEMHVITKSTSLHVYSFVPYMDN